jgi:hypothetical protein
LDARRAQRLAAPWRRVFENASSLTRGMAVWRYGDWSAAALPAATLAGLAARSNRLVEHHSVRFGDGRDRVVITEGLKNRAQGKRRLIQLGGRRSRLALEGGGALRLMSYRPLER